MSFSSSLRDTYRISTEEIHMIITQKNNLKSIGDGGFSHVYKEEISKTGQTYTAAIKFLKPEKNTTEDLYKEVDIVSRFHHRNIIPFIGYYEKGKDMIMVYEYAVKGSLSSHLDDREKRGRLSWIQRLKICLGIAKGLSYLHSKGVIHRDLKSDNILLDSNMEAKLCDFGMSKSLIIGDDDIKSKLYINVGGTPYYMDPAYKESRMLRKESDVFSFGVVMFELLAGMLAHRYRPNEAGKPKNLINLVRPCYKTGLEEFIDPRIRNQIDIENLDPNIAEHVNISSFFMFKEIAYPCISLTPKERPTIDTIVQRIEEALDIQEKIPSLIKCVSEGKRLSYGHPSNGKPVAAFTIYKHLVDFKHFEAENTTVFKRLMQIIDVEIKRQDAVDYKAYWSTNALALLFLIQQPNLKFDVPRSMVFSSSSSSSVRKGVDALEANHPAFLFKQELTSCIEILYAIIRDSLKEELGSLLTKRIQDYATVYDSSRPRPQLIKGILDCLNTLINTLKENFVPPKIVQKIIAQMISYIKVVLFNSILEKPECCTDANAKYLRDDLEELKKWCSQYASESIDNLVELDEMTELLMFICKLPRSRPPVKNYICPSLSRKQLEKIQKHYMNSKRKYAANHVIDQTIKLMNKESNKNVNYTDLLEDNSSGPISINDLLEAKCFSSGERDVILSEFPAFPFLHKYI